MGITIHYSISVPPDWTSRTIRSKLEAARQFALSLPVKEVSELAEFRGRECDFQHIRDTGREDSDDFFWAKIQACRSIYNPYFPGSSMTQPPSRMIVFRVDVGPGCEEMNLGVCSFAKHVWKADRRPSDLAPAWSMVFKNPKSYPDSHKVIRSFMRRWHLVKLADSRKGIFASDRFGGPANMVYHGGYVSAEIRHGRYLSHRRGYAGDMGLVLLRDRMGPYELYFKFRGTADQARQVFASPEFQADLNKLVLGDRHVTPAARGVWSSFCKTLYASKFIECHLTVLAVLEHLQMLGFKVEVSDEAGYWESRDLEQLAQAHGESSEALAALAGTLKDSTAGSGLSVEAPIMERKDFEHLEAKGQARIADLLSHLRKAGKA